MKQFITGPSVPTAQICINKSRLKIHNKETDPTYYLKSGQEFQMEFYNPTSGTILAKIYLNGKAISQGGLVLRPAERVFLNRYLDIAKKFLFDTYEVSNTQAVKEAIKNNGDFKVEFFRESVPASCYYGSSTTTIMPTYWPHTLTIGNPSCFTSTGSSGILRGSASSGSINLASAGQSMSCCDTSNISLTNSGGNNIMYNASNSEAYMDSLSQQSFSDQKSAPQLRSLAKKSIETGRVEAGSNSDQKIKTVDKSFDYWAFHTVEYKLLPISQKVNTAADVNVARYCTSCGFKTGKTDKFCAKCGTRI